MNKVDLKQGFDAMLGVGTIIRRKQKNIQNQRKNAFINIIKKYDESLTKSVMLASQFRIDLSDYEDPYYEIIDSLFQLSYGPDIYTLIEFYFYKRIGEDGVENFLEDENGKEIYIRTPDDLYEIINRLYPGTI